MNPLIHSKLPRGLKPLIALVVVCLGLLMSEPLAQKDPKKDPKIPPDLLFKDFDVVPSGLDALASSLDANGFPLNPRWGKQISFNSLPSPAESCPIETRDPNLFRSAQFPNCTSYPVKLNSSEWCGQHINFMTVTYEGTIEWDGVGPGAPFDMDYTFDVSRDDQALYTARDNQIHVEFDRRETVHQWDGTDTWWEKFHHDGVDKGDDHARDMIDGHSVIVIGLLGLDTPHRGKPELHPAYAIFVLLDRNRVLRQTRWAFFVRNWGNEGICGSGRLSVYKSPIKVQIRRAVQVVSQNTWAGARNGSRADLNKMRMDPQLYTSMDPTNFAGIELRFTLLPPDKESWIMGDVTFQEPIPGVTGDLKDKMWPPFDFVRAESKMPKTSSRDEEKMSPQAEAIQAQINKLPEGSRKELLAQLEAIGPRVKGIRLPQAKVPPETIQLGGTQLKPSGSASKTDWVRQERDPVGELSRRQMLEVTRKFFAQRGIKIELPREK